MNLSKWAWLVLWLLPVATQAGTVALTTPGEVQLLERQLSHAATDISIDSIDQLAALESVVWTNGSARNRVGFDDEVANWYRISLRTQIDADWMALIEHAQLTRLDAFLIESGQQVKQWRWQMANQTPDNSFKGRPRFALDLTPGTTYQLYLRVEGSYSVYAPLVIGSTRAVSDWLVNKLTFIYIFFGIMLGLLLYNGVLAIVVRHKSARHYCLYLLCVVLYNLQINGIGRQWVGNLDGYWDRFFVYASTLGVLVFSLAFSRSFLSLEKSGTGVQVSQGVIGALLALAGVGIVIDQPMLFVNTMQLAAPLFFAFALTVGAMAIKRGNRYAIFYELGWAAMALGTLVHQLLLMGYLPTSLLLQESFRIGASVEALMLSWALAMRLRAIEVSNRHVETQAKKKLERANEQLSHALHVEEVNSKMKEDFIRLVGHELRTPLNALISSIDLMCEDKYRNPGEFREDSHIALARLSCQVENLVTASELSREALQERTQGVRDWCALSSVLDRVDDYAKDRLKDKPNVRLEIRGSGADTQVFFDQQKVERCLINLIDNAIKFTEQGRVLLDIQVSPGLITFSVSDQGPGMSDEQRAKAFDIARDTQDVMLRKHEGFGLGLYVTSGLVQCLSGELRFSERSPHGLKVDLILPAQTKELSDYQPRKRLPAAIVRVLVVEDNRLNAKLLVRLLESMGLVVELAEHGARAVEMAQATHYNIILMDLQMPVMDGFQAAKSIRQQVTSSHDVVILATSANNSFNDRDLAIKSGMDGFISKPIRPSTLRRELGLYIAFDNLTEVAL